MCYLKGTTSHGLHYTEYPMVLEGYNDGNYISDVYEMKDTREYVFTLGGDVVSWESC